MNKNTKELEQNVWLVWKNLGETPLQSLERFRRAQPQFEKEKMTYAGRLDPLAQGWLLILIGEKCKQKDEYLGLDKIYEFTVLFGVKTDTLDVLGMIDNFFLPEKIDFHAQNLDFSFLPELIGKHQWPYPAYSSKTFRGVSLWRWARKGKYTELLAQKLIPMNEFEIYNLELLESSSIAASDLLDEVSSKIKLVSGDFRQKEILARWREVLDFPNNTHLIELQTAKFRIQCSSGTYVRQIAGEIAARAGGFPGVALDLVRTEFVGL